MPQPVFQKMSVEEYLRTEADSPVKREYVGGFVYARIISRILRAVEPVAEAQGCRAYASEIKLRIDAQQSFYSPDVMVVCGPENSDPYSETAPCLLVEVLSRGTAHTDRHAKYAYTREGTSWKLTEYVGEDVIPLACLGLELRLGEIYAGVL